MTRRRLEWLRGAGQRNCPAQSRGTYSSFRHRSLTDAQWARLRPLLPPTMISSRCRETGTTGVGPAVDSDVPPPPV
jgi:hypothetical protein